MKTTLATKSKVIFILLTTIFIVFICLWAFRRFKTENYPLTISENDLYKIDFNCNPTDIENKYGQDNQKIETAKGRVIFQYKCKFLWDTKLLSPESRIIFDFSENKLTVWTVIYVQNNDITKFIDIDKLEKTMPIGYKAKNITKILGYPFCLYGNNDFPSEVIYEYRYTTDNSTDFPSSDYSFIKIIINLKNGKVKTVKYEYMGKDLNEVLKNGFIEKSY